MEDTAPASLGALPAMETLLHRSNWILTKPATTSRRVRVACAYSTTAVGLLRLPKWRGRSRPSPLWAQRSHTSRRPSALISSSTMANTRRRGPKSTKTKSESASNQTGSRLARTWNKTRINSEVNGQKGRFVFRTTCLLMSLFFCFFFQHPQHYLLVPPTSVLACREWFLCFHLLKQRMLWGLASPPPVLTLVCWWLTVQQLCDLRSSKSAGCVACCWAADVTACLGSDLLSEAAENKTTGLDMNVTLSHLQWELALFLVCSCVCFPVYRSRGRDDTCQSVIRRGTSWLFNVR